MDQMTPSRPYLLRAFYDWLLDNELTPHLLVNAEVPHTMVPRQYVKDGQIVLSIAPQAVVGLQMDNEAVSFSARFGGSPFQVYIPMAAIVAIQARENGAGTFSRRSPPTRPGWPPPVRKDEVATPPEMGESQPSTGKKGKPNLRVIK
jgi:stringent starvation protein B